MRLRRSLRLLLPVLTLSLLAPAMVAAETITLPSNLARYGNTQTDFFHIQAEPGLLELRVEANAEAGSAGALLYDLETEEPLIEHLFDGRVTESQTTTIGKAGEYGLILFENQLHSLQVSAEGLIVDPLQPAITLPIAPFATWNDPAPLRAGLANPQITAGMALYLGDALVSDELLQPSGLVAPITLDTTGLADGIYGLTLVAQSSRSENASYLFRPLLVDRELSFVDVPFSHWAHAPIEVMYHSAIVNGRQVGLFEPEGAVLRSEFAKMLAVTLGLKASPEATNPFVDLPADHWALPYIVALYEAGLAQGEEIDGQRYFHPEQTISRAEVATLVGRVLDVAEGAYEAPAFTDWSAVPDWARPSVANLAEAGWLNGFPDGSYRPEAELLRSQAAKVLAKFLGM